MEKITGEEIVFFLQFYITFTKREDLYLRLADANVIINIKKLGAFETIRHRLCAFFPSYIADIHRGGK